MKLRELGLVLAAFALWPACTRAHDPDGQRHGHERRTPAVAGWWKGNTHAHTWWSDGNAPAESVAAWYRERGYHFLVLSDHNRMQEGQLWYRVDTEQKRESLRRYRRDFGGARRFIFIRGMEITDRLEQHPVHLNGVNLEKTIVPQGGPSVPEMLQRNVDAVVDQGRRSGRPMFAHVNHPNFFYAVTAEDLIALDHAPGDGFVEAYKGHSGVRNDGDAFHPSTERMWDIVLAKRIAERGTSVMFGLATDDSHEYTEWGLRKTNPGRGSARSSRRFAAHAHATRPAATRSTCGPA
jgi:hypothetical protein